MTPPDWYDVITELQRLRLKAVRRVRSHSTFDWPAGMRAEILLQIERAKLRGATKIQLIDLLERLFADYEETAGPLIELETA